MSNVINRVTKEFKKSVNTPDFSEVDWIINPILPKCEQKYWKIDGNSVLEMTDEEKDIAYPTKTEIEINMAEMVMIRVKRDALLRETDWTQVNDSPLKDNVEILAYRQSLRDITESAKDVETPTDKTKEGPTKIIWPVKPEV